MEYSLVIRDRLRSNGPITSITKGKVQEHPCEYGKDLDGMESSSTFEDVEKEAQKFISEGKYSAAAELRTKAKQVAEERKLELAKRIAPPDYELVASGGKGTSTGVRKFSWGIRCDTHSETDVENVLHIWKLLLDNKDEYVVLGMLTCTRVLKSTKDGLQELKPQDTLLQQLRFDIPTLFVGTLGNENNGIVQVCEEGILLVNNQMESTWIERKDLCQEALNEFKRVVVNPTEIDSEIFFTDISVVDQIILISFSNGTFLIRKVVSNRLTKLDDDAYDTEQCNKILYGTIENGEIAPVRIARLINGPEAKAFLYFGEEQDDLVVEEMEEHALLVIIRGGLTKKRAGEMEAYRLSNLKPLFQSSAPLALGENLLTNQLNQVEQPSLMEIDENSETENDTTMQQNKTQAITSVLANTFPIDFCFAMVGFQAEDNIGCTVGEMGNAQHLIGASICFSIALNNGDIMVYKAKKQITKGKEKKFSCCAFERVRHTTVTRGIRQKPGVRNPLTPVINLDGGGKFFRFPLFHKFVGNCNCGIFVTSTSPVWILGSRGAIRVTPMNTGASRPLPLPVKRRRQLIIGGNPGVTDPSFQTTESITGETALTSHHVNIVKGAINSLIFLDSQPGMFLYYYSAPVSETTKPKPNTVTSLDIERLHAPSLRLCSFAGTMDINSKRSNPPRIELDQNNGIGLVTESFPIGTSIHKLMYLDFASNGSTQESQMKKHSAVYVALLLREIPVAPLPNIDNMDEDREPVYGPDGAQEIDGLVEGFATRPDSFTCKPEYGGKPKFTDYQGSVALFRGGDWNTPCDEFMLLPYERALCVNIVKVKTQQSEVEKEFIAVGTGIITPEGEDRGCKGRVIVFDIVHGDSGGETVAPGRPQTVPRLRLVTDRVSLINKKEPRGPVTAISSLEGKLLVAMGNMPSSIKLCHVDEHNKSVIPHKFFDTPICVTTLNVIKNYILVGDMYKGVQFIHWQLTNKEFKLLVNDKDPIQVYSSEYIVNGKQLGIVVNDKESNLQIFQFKPNQPLLRVGDFHLGSKCSEMLRIPLRSNENGSSKIKKHIHGLFFGTLDGSIGTVIPLDEIVFRRLYALQAAIVKCENFHHNAGLNPRGYRLLRTEQPLSRQRKGNIADGFLLDTFLSLDYLLQNELARMVGTTIDTIIDSLGEIEIACRW